MIFLLDPYKQTNYKIRQSLNAAGYDEKKIFDIPEPQTVINKIHEVIDTGETINMIIADIYFKGDFTSLKIVKEFDPYPALWKTPFILYTNETDKSILEQYSRFTKHIPLIYILKSNVEAIITKSLSNISKQIEKDLIYIDAELKIKDMIENGDVEMIPNIEMEFNILKWAHKDIQRYRLDAMLGELYFNFWKKGNKKVEELKRRMSSMPRGTTGYELVKNELTAANKKNNPLLEKAEKILADANKDNKHFWKTSYVQYEIAVEKGDYRTAKGYLLQLIKLFPEEFDYSYKLGRIYAMENEYNLAMEYFENASKMALIEGSSGISAEDILDIANESMKMAQKIMVKSNASDFNDLKKVKEDSEEYYLLNIMKKNNAQIRTALLNLSTKPNSNKLLLADYQNKIAITFRRNADYVMGMNTYQEAIKLDPTNPIIRLNYAACLALLKLFEQAEIEVLKSKEYNNDDIEENIIEKVLSLIKGKNVEGIKRILV